MHAIKFSMEFISNFSICSIIILSTILVVLVGSRRKRCNPNQRLPPGPKGWPVIGNIFDIGTLPHIGLSQLKPKYGPIVWLKICSRKTVVLLTSTAAAEYFKNHDSSVDRIVIEAMRSHDFHKSPMTLSRNGGYWRALKRVCTMQLFNSKKINETRHIREKCVNDMLLWFQRDMEQTGCGAVEVTKFVFPTLFNVLGNVMVSRDLVDPESRIGSEFYTHMTGIVECWGSPNVSDLFPWLRRLDLQGLRRKTDVHLDKLLNFSLGYVKERVDERMKGTEMRRNNDFLDVLLDFKGSKSDEPTILSEKDIAVIILEMFLAGSETSSTTIEWAMSEIIRNPQVMIKIQAELLKVVEPSNKFEEAHIDNMHYLQAVIKETLRLHPPAALLLPRKTTQDINLMGYYIPKDTFVMVDVWAIGRDPDYWDDHSLFKPERFLGSDIDYKGQDFELIPFGSGRRTCVGLPLAERMVHLILGSLLHEFEWQLDDTITPETMDMKERIGVTARKSDPLKAIPKRSTTMMIR